MNGRGDFENALMQEATMLDGLDNTSDFIRFRSVSLEMLIGGWDTRDHETPKRIGKLKEELGGLHPKSKQLLTFIAK
jgi:hypothetical protein